METPSWINEIPFMQAKQVGPERSTSDIRFIAIHTADGPRTSEHGAAESVATYFSDLDRAASAHYVIGAYDAYKCVDLCVTAWGIPELNRPAIHVELTASSSDDAETWNDADHAELLSRGADLFAFLCYTYNVPAQLVSDADLQTYGSNSVRGIVTHEQCTRLLFPNEGHTDPGPNFPLGHFLAAVQERLG